MSEKIETIQLPNGTLVSGYEGEYIFERIKSTKQFYEQSILEQWIAPLKEEIKVVYDIGANIGNHTVYFATQTSAEQIYSFEPVKLNYDMLHKNIEDNEFTNVKAYNMALGESVSEAVMEITKENNNGSAKIVEQVKSGDGFKVQVQVIDKLGLPNPDFIKVDVEGYEVSVLRGMLTTLSQTQALVWIEVDEENAEVVYDIMHNAGYYVKDYHLQSSNNILFTNNKADCMENSKKVFASLLQESAQKRQYWISLGIEMSKYQYEQKKAEELKQQLGSEKSKLEYEQKKAEELREQLNQVRQQQKETIKKLEIRAQERVKDLKQQLEKRTSNFLYEQKKAAEYKLKYQQIDHKLKVYEKAKLVRFTLWSWKVRGKIKFYIKKKVYKFGHFLYIKLLPHQKLRSMCSRLNGKLGIFKDIGKVVAYREEQQMPEQSVVIQKSVKKEATQINVAMVVDEFTYNSFRYECNPFPVEPSNWQEIFEKNKIDLFFCESAWAGLDIKKRPWKGQVYCSVNFKGENRHALLAILDYCKKHNIPTVFWNKEDPTHYPDKVHNFVDTAVRFDHVFTTDRDCVERYKKDYGHKSVHCLMFATQPRLFNPIEKFERSNEIIFAGSWYNQHSERCKEMGDILDNILRSGYPLKIYDRQSENDDPNHYFPERFHPYLNPCLKHDELDVAYKGSHYALNINTVTDSDTMFARRVFELMSSNTLVLSNYSRGMEELFGDNVVFVDGEKQISVRDLEEKKERCLYEVLNHHTYRSRFQQILRDIGFPYVEQKQEVGFLYSITCMTDADKAIEHFKRMNWDDKRAILYVMKETNTREFRHILEKYQSKKIVVIYQDYCMKYEDVLQNDSAYFIWTDTTLDSEFVRKAVVHYQYIDHSVGIAQSNKKYVFEDKNSIYNTLYMAKRFDNIKTYVNTKSNITEQVYVI